MSHPQGTDQDDEAPTLIGETKKVPVTILTGYLGEKKNRFGTIENFLLLSRRRKNDLAQLYSNCESSETNRRHSQWIRSRKRYGTSSAVEHDRRKEFAESRKISRLARTSKRLSLLFCQVKRNGSSDTDENSLFFSLLDFVFSETLACKRSNNFWRNAEIISITFFSRRQALLIRCPSPTFSGWTMNFTVIWFSTVRFSSRWKSVCFRKQDRFSLPSLALITVVDGFHALKVNRPNIH